MFDAMLFQHYDCDQIMNDLSPKLSINELDTSHNLYELIEYYRPYTSKTKIKQGINIQ